jgi:hypothetical protein
VFHKINTDNFSPHSYALLLKISALIRTNEVVSKEIFFAIYFVQRNGMLFIQTSFVSAVCYIGMNRIRNY